MYILRFYENHLAPSTGNWKTIWANRVTIKAGNYYPQELLSDALTHRVWHLFTGHGMDQSEMEGLF